MQIPKGFMPQYTENQSTEKDFKNIISSIYSLMKDGQEWIKFTKLAHEIYGDLDQAQVIVAYCGIPQYRKYFCYNTQVVKLTEEGIEFCRTLPDYNNLNEEVAYSITRYIKDIKPIKIRIKDSVSIRKTENYYICALQTDVIDEVLHGDTPVTFFSDKEGKIHGKILSQDDNGTILYVALKQELCPALLPGTLLVQNGFLLVELRKHLEGLNSIPKFYKYLFESSDFDNGSMYSDDSEDIAKQIFAAKSPWAKILWGPPGAGKTYAIARFVVLSIVNDAKKKILVLAASNKAVDVLTEQIYVILEKEYPMYLKERKLLRYGYPISNEVISHKEILGPEIVDRLSEDLKKISNKIAVLEKNGTEDDGEIAIQKTLILEIQERMKKEVSNHLATCQVVATTTTLSYFDEAIRNKDWSSLIIDEITMVPPAICYFLCSLTNDNIFLSGDPLQLGPIFQETYNTAKETKDWLGTDIFKKMKISEGDLANIKINFDDERLAYITKQRRCSEPIWTLVKNLYPEIGIITNSFQKEIAAIPPLPGESVVLIDYSECKGNYSCEKIYQSWQNIFSAKIAFELAVLLKNFERDFSIGIITPYRAQMKLIKNWLKKKKLKNEIDVGTIHQFQGSASDIIIFDLTDGRNRKNLGYLLRDDFGLRLVNVAFTRARGKLVIILDKDWLFEFGIQSNNYLLEDLIRSNKNIIKMPAIVQEEIPVYLQKLAK